MKVFILSTGRCGSYTIIQACRHINNYTAAHESRTSLLGRERLNYPDWHIESDNRLSWFLGSLEKKFGDDAVYVHLIRNKPDTVASLQRRWGAYISINKAFVNGILKTPFQLLRKEDRVKVSELYYDTVNDNIAEFLKGKEKTMTVRLEHIDEDFKHFWELIGAEGDYEAAIQELHTKHNKSRGRKFNFRYRAKLFFWGLFRW